MTDEWEIWEPTIEDYFSTTITVDEQKEKLEILDTHGFDECFHAMRYQWIRECHVCMLI